MARVVRVGCMAGVSWFTSYNLWICDEAHKDTCSYSVSLTRPTDRQVRKMKKSAKKHFRFGTREAQRKRYDDLRNKISEMVTE